MLQTIRPGLRWALLTTFVIPLSACVSYASDQQIVHMRVPSDTALAQINPGHTPSAWLLENLGEPDGVSSARGHDAVWQYENIHAESKQLRAFPLLGLYSEARHTTVYNFAVEQNTIMRYWKEAL